MKLILLIAAYLISFNGLTQNILFGPEIGMNLIVVEEQTIGDDYQPAWYGGGNIEYVASNLFSIQSGLYFTQKKQSYASSDTTVSDVLELLGPTIGIEGINLSTYTTTTHRQSQAYLEIPITASFNYDPLRIFLGGYVGFMIAGKTKSNAVADTPFMSTIEIDSLLGGGGGIGGGLGGGLFETLLPPAHSETYSESTDKSNLSILDFGLKGGIGYQQDRIGIYASYNFGLSDYRKDRGTDAIKRHHYFQFSVRYLFGKNNP